MAKLLVYSADGGMTERQLGELSYIGRHPESTIQILDAVVSKRHARVYRENDNWVLQDLGSSNGTYVNGERTQFKMLVNGDEIRLGNTRLVFQADAPTPKAAVTIMASGMQHAILAKLGADDSQQFLPADKIANIEQLKRDYEKLRVANELAQAVGLESDVDKLLPRILDETFKLLHADRGVVMLSNVTTGELETGAVKRRREGNDEIVLSNTVIQEVVSKRAAVLTNDATIDERFSTAKSVIASGMRSTMVVPMMYEGQLFGLIYLDSTLARGVFSEKDLQILSGVAAQAAQSIDNARKAQELERNALARRDFEKLLPPEIVEQVVSGKVKVERGGETRPTTVMFTDVRGFTAWSERHEASHIVTILNEYFELMVDAIHKHNGTLDKFMGDGIMALFGAPVSHGNDAFNAVACAVEMMAQLRPFNAKLTANNLQPIEIGIGLNTGPVVVGYMGSSKSMEYTAIGDHVNLSARLCGVAAPNQILITHETLRHVHENVRATQLEPVRVKGKSEPIPIYHLHGLRTEGGPGDQTSQVPVAPEPT